MKRCIVPCLRQAYVNNLQAKFKCPYFLVPTSFFFFRLSHFCSLFNFFCFHRHAIKTNLRIWNYKYTVHVNVKIQLTLNLTETLLSIFNTTEWKHFFLKGINFTWPKLNFKMCQTEETNLIFGIPTPPCNIL